MEKVGGTTAILRAIGISKRFGPIVANNNVSLTLNRGEILAVLGENGAGKTTLMKILSGLIRPESGTIELDGNEVTIANPAVAARHGIGMVHQHFSLAPTLTVAENIVLGQEPRRRGLYDYARARERARELAQLVGFDIEPEQVVENLSVTRQQRVEILKVLSRSVRILALDEPTAVLAPQAVEDLFNVIRHLVAQGISVLFITHKLGEALALADRILVMRHGSVVGELPAARATEADLARLMVGHEVARSAALRCAGVGEPVLELEDVTLAERGSTKLDRLQLVISRGEIVGLAGVEGNGQTELERVIVGLERAYAGSISFCGSELSGWPTRLRLERGLHFIPGDRQAQGLLLDFSLEENLILGAHWRRPVSRGLFMRRKAIRREAQELLERFDVRPRDPLAAARRLSGGNQQRLILARALAVRPVFLLAPQPTRGLDIAAIEFVHRQLRALRDASTGILLISFDLDELLELSDRIAVLYRGKIVAELQRADFDRELIGLYMVRGAATEEHSSAENAAGELAGEHVSATGVRSR